MIVTTAQLFKIAYGKYAIGAYNINNLEQTVGLFQGNVQSKAPFIIQLSRGARKYTDKRYLEAMIRTSQEVYPDAIFAVHLDHGDEQTCYDCIASGFYSSVMIDASHEPFEKNVEICKNVVTKCDSLAVAIGTSHGAYKFKAEPGKKFGLHFEVIEAIQKLLPGYPMVMHGSSSVPKDEVDRINKAGGKMQETSGVPEGDFIPAAKLGVCKVNIDTDGRLVWTRVHREFFRDHPEKFDLRDPGKIYIEEYAKMMAHKNQALGSAGQLDDVRAKLGKK